MDADSVAEAVFGLHPTGPMVIHVVDHDYEYWLEVTAIKSASLVEPPWTGGVIIETKPIPAGVMARRPILNPRPYFRTPNTPMQTPAERLQDLQAEGALDFIPQENPKVSKPRVNVALPPMVGVDPGIAVSGVKITDWEIDINYRMVDRYPADQQFRISDRKPVYITPPESSGVVEIPVDPHYGRPPTIDDIATKSPEQLAQMYPNGIAGVSTSETDNLQPPTTDPRFQQYRDPFRDAGKSYARMEIAQHGQLPETGWRYETAPEFQGAGTEHLAEELELKKQAAQELVEKNPFQAEDTEPSDQSEPHYAVAREINERQITEAFGTDHLFANPHMGDPKE